MIETQVWHGIEIEVPALPPGREAAEREHDLASCLAAIDAGLAALQSRMIPGSGELLAALRVELAAARAIIRAEDQRPQSFDLATAVRSWVVLEADRGLAVSVDLPGTLPVLGTPESVVRVLRNLLDNVRHHAPGASVDITATSDGPWTVLRVLDTGPGLLPDVARPGPTPSDRGRSGLGLHACARVMQRQGGALRVSSSADGCVVELRLRNAPRPPVLPRLQPDGWATPAPTHSPADGERLVLVVDDHLLVAGGVVAALRDSGVRAGWCSIEHPAAVLEEAASLRPALILLDLIFDGSPSRALGLIGPLRALGAGVVAFTGTRDPVLLGAALHHGAAGILHKDDTIEALVGKVHRCLSGADVMAEQSRRDYLQRFRAHSNERDSELAPFAHLSRRECEVLDLLMKGQSAEAIATAGFVSLTTVRAQIRAVLGKLGVNSQLAAVALANRAGWTLSDARS